MEKRIAVGIALGLVLSVAPAMAASHEAISSKTLATFHALSKLHTGERAVSTSLTDDQLASIEGASSWSDGVVIEQLTKGGGTNIAIVRQQNGESVVVEQQIGGKSTTEAVRVPELSGVLLLGPLTGRVGAIVEQLLKSQGPFAGPQILHPLRNGGALGRREGP